MKNKLKVLVFTTIFGLLVPSFAQTTKSSSRNTGRNTGLGGDNRENRQGIIREFVRAIIAGKLRHPDPKIRIQAIQTIASGMISGNNNDDDDDDDNNSGVRNLFSIGNNGDDNDGGTGIGAEIYIPDLYSLLADPDPEVRDTASIALDALFDTDTTLMRFMEDEDPIIRKYATKIYANRAFSGNNNDNNDNDDDDNDNNGGGDLEELLALRYFLVRLKYEEDIEIRKIITDAIERYLRKEGIGVMGVDMTMYAYLNDENPEIRKNAVKIISELDYNPKTLQTFMEMLKTEKDPGVKAELQKAIDNFIQKQKQYQEVEQPGLRTR